MQHKKNKCNQLFFSGLDSSQHRWTVSFRLKCFTSSCIVVFFPLGRMSALFIRPFVLALVVGLLFYYVICLVYSLCTGVKFNIIWSKSLKKTLRHWQAADLDSVCSSCPRPGSDLGVDTAVSDRTGAAGAHRPFSRPADNNSVYHAAIGFSVANVNSSGAEFNHNHTITFLYCIRKSMQYNNTNRRNTDTTGTSKSS